MSARLRLLIPMAAIAFVVSGHAPVSKPDSITYKTEAKRADIVVGEIARQAGLQLATTEDAKLHFLVIAVTDADTETLLANIAKVTSSQWETDGERRTLVIDPVVRRLEAADRDSKRIGSFKKSQEHMRKRLAAKPMDPASTEEELTREDYVEPYSSPAEKALAELAILIDPKQAAAIGDSGRVVFSTAPNRMQRSMTSAAATRILNTLVADHNRWAAEEIKNNELTRNEMMADPEMAAYLAMFGDPTPKLFVGAPSKALLVLESTASMFGFEVGSPQVELKVYDQKGTVVIHETMSLDGDGSNFMDQYEIGADGELIEKVSKDKQQQEIKPEDRIIVKFSEKTKVLSSIESMDENAFQMTEELTKVLRDPTTNDPLGFHHTDILHAIAVAKKLNVVANLADSGMFDQFSMGPTQEGVTIGKAYQALLEEGASKIEEKDGWMAISPADPISARVNRQDRYVLKAFIDAILRDGAPTLDSTALFALNSPPPMKNGTSVLYMLAFAQNMIQGLMGGGSMDWPMLRFYGTLMPQQKTSLRQGARMSFSTLTSRSRDVLTTMAFSSDANIQPMAKLAEVQKAPFFMQIMGSMLSASDPKDFTEEPTEVMPNGLSSDGFVELNVAGEPIAKPAEARGFTALFFGALSADEFAMFDLMKETSFNELNESGMFEVPQKVRLGSRENLRFVFHLSPQAGIAKTLVDDSIDKDAQVISVSDLPPVFKTLIEQRKKALKESPWGRMMGGIGSFR